MELYRKANVFERILSLHTSPQISTKIQHKIIQVVCRAIQVGGSMTLITRAGILSWIDIQLAVTRGQDTGILQALKSAIEGSIDRMEVEAWKTRSTKR
jgi:nucleolar pre-ribosomal-associated protein 1